MVTKDTHKVFAAAAATLKDNLKRASKKQKNTVKRQHHRFTTMIATAKRVPEIVLNNVIQDSIRAAGELDKAELEKFNVLGVELFNKPMFKQACYNLSYEIQTVVGAMIKHTQIYVDIEKMCGLYVWRMADPDGDETIPLPHRSGMHDFSLTMSEKNGLSHATVTAPVNEKGEPRRITSYDPLILGAVLYRNYKQGGILNADIEEMVNDFVSLVVYDLGLISNALAWLHINDYFPFSVEDANRYRAYCKKHGNPPATTKVVFLNKLPESGKAKKFAERSGGSMSGHQRKGYWVTLRADRFKDHPMYMVHKGVYRQPTWVGPTSTEYEGNIYKVLLPGEDFDQKLK